MKNRIFTDNEEKLLKTIGTVIQVQPGHPVYMKGDVAERVYYVIKGRVRVYENISSGREMTLDVVEAGRIFGESAFVGGNLRPTCVQAVNAVTLISMRVSDLLPYFRQEPDLALHFLQLCSYTMDYLTERMEDQCLLDRYGKVANYLLNETRMDSEEKGTVGGVLPYTHEDLAVSLGLNRSTVTMVLKKFEKEGWVSSGYQQVKVINRKALEKMVEQQKNQ